MTRGRQLSLPHVCMHKKRTHMNQQFIFGRDCTRCQETRHTGTAIELRTTEKNKIKNKHLFGHNEMNNIVLYSRAQPFSCTYLPRSDLCPNMHAELIQFEFELAGHSTGIT